MGLRRKKIVIIEKVFFDNEMKIGIVQPVQCSYSTY